MKMSKFQIILLSILFLIAFLLGFLSISIANDFFHYDVSKISDYCHVNADSCDSISIAYQLGRLDFIGVSLTLLGVTVALSAVFGFLSIKEKSEYIANKIAEEYISNHLREFDTKLPSILEPKITVLFDKYKTLKERENGHAVLQDDWASKVED